MKTGRSPFCLGGWCLGIKPERGADQSEFALGQHGADMEGPGSKLHPSLTQVYTHSVQAL